MTTNTEVESVPASVDNEPMKTHRVCRTCHPVVAMGTPALCGTHVLGIRGTHKSRCEDCLKAATGHRLMHYGGAT